MKTSAQKRIGVIGLGMMGTAIKQRLLEHGDDALVCNRTRAKAHALIATGARWSDNPLAACDRVDALGLVIIWFAPDTRSAEL